MSVPQTGNRESPKTNDVLQRSSVSAPVLGDLVKRPFFCGFKLLSASGVPDVDLFQAAREESVWSRTGDPVAPSPRRGAKDGPGVCVTAAGIRGSKLQMLGGTEEGKRSGSVSAGGAAVAGQE